METTPAQPPSAERLAPVFAALGQAARLEVVRLLLAAYPAPVPAGEIQQALGIPASTLSHHLHRLREVGLVDSVRESQWIRYVARADSLQAILDFLYSECCSRNAVVDPDVSGRCC